MLSPSQLSSVARQYGTPLYVYDAGKIKEQYEKLVHAFRNSQVYFYYACKALTNIHILRYIKELGSNIDCSSVNEVKLALYAGFPAERILYTSNGISFAEIEEAASLGVNINIDSLSNLEKFGRRFGHNYPVGIRLRPNILAGGNLKISTGHDRSKFGIPVEDMPAILELVSTHSMQITNLHIHTGSEIKDAEIFIRGIEVLFDLIPHFPELKSVDLGGGFKVPYKEGDDETDMEILGQRVKQAFDAHPVARNLQIWFEPGKFMVSDCGFLVTTVNVLKETAVTVFAGVDSGFNHLIRPMFYDAYHKIENISNPEGKEHIYTVTGNICETDTFAWDRKLPEVREGDLLVFHNAGAYGFEMSSRFNSRYRPAEVMIEDGEARLIRRRDNFDDLLRNQLEV